MCAALEACQGAPGLQEPQGQLQGRCGGAGGAGRVQRTALAMTCQLATLVLISGRHIELAQRLTSALLKPEVRWASVMLVKRLP